LKKFVQLIRRWARPDFAVGHYSHLVVLWFAGTRNNHCSARACPSFSAANEATGRRLGRARFCMAGFWRIRAKVAFLPGVQAGLHSARDGSPGAAESAAENFQIAKRDAIVARNQGKEVFSLAAALTETRSNGLDGWTGHCDLKASIFLLSISPSGCEKIMLLSRAGRLRLPCCKSRLS